MYIPNLLIIAGTGTKSGKTTAACTLIKQFEDLEVTAIKISPHFHEISPGLVLKAAGEGYSVYEETNSESPKDTSRMRRAGKAKVYLILVWDSDLEEVFKMVLKEIPEGTPIICESPALRNYFEPGLFVIMSSQTENKRQDLRYLQNLPHLNFKLEEVDKTDILPIQFANGKWSSSL
jgi:hypothetical protein